MEKAGELVSVLATTVRKLLFSATKHERPEKSVRFIATLLESCTTLLVRWTRPLPEQVRFIATQLDSWTRPLPEQPRGNMLSDHTVRNDSYRR